MNKIIKYAGINAAATAAYIAGVVSLLFWSGQGRFEHAKPTILIPIGMLLLFVCSAAITGSLVFGRPALWYLEGKKREALILLFSTIGILGAIALIIFLFLLSGTMSQ